MKIRKMSRGAVLGSLVVAGALVVPAVAAPLSAPAPDPYPRIAFVARNDNPFDALGVGAIAGAVGGVIAITPPSSLSVPAATVLTEFDPDLVIIAGGPGAVSEQVEADVEALGDWDVERAAGNTRDETAREVARVIQDHGLARPAMLSTASGQNVGDLYLGGHFEAESATIAGVDIPQAPAPGPMVWSYRDRLPSTERIGDGPNGTTEFALDIDVPADGGVVVVDFNALLRNEDASAQSAVTYLSLDENDTSGDASQFYAGLFGVMEHAMNADGDPTLGDSTSAPTHGVVEVDAGEHTIYAVVLLPTDVTLRAPALTATWYPSGSAVDVGVVVPVS